MTTLASVTEPYPIGYEEMPLEEARSYIQTFDLSSTINRLIYVENWFKKHAIAACTQYRNYLYLQKKYSEPGKILTPSYEIDEAWHAHILHTKEYVTFCYKVYGRYLHHTPHLAQQAGDLKKLEEQYAETQRLYHQEFGDYIYQIRRNPRGIRKRLASYFNRLSPNLY